MLAASNDMVTSQSQIPVIQVLLAGLARREEPADLVNVSFAHRRRRTAIPAVGGAVTADAPAMGAALAMTLSIEHFCPVVIALFR
jgi:hypothetical protein